MMILSKCQTIDTTCIEYVHPWSNSCVLASLSLLAPCIKESLRIYIAAYSLTLLFKGKIPTKKVLKNTVLGILQSCLFLTSHGVGYSAVVCLIRRIIGNYNFYTVSFIPSFLSSILSILIERPSRRALLSLYVTNVASETLFRMAVSRKLVKPIRFGEVLIFALSISNLLYFYKGHGLPKDAVYSLLRFLVGPSEEKDYVKQDERVFLAPDQKEINKNSFSLYEQIIQWYQSKILKLKSLSLHSCCPHYHSCVHNALSSGFQKFVKGYIVQVAIKVIINFKKITKRPNLLIDILLRMETFNLGLCLGLFATIYRGVSCALRRLLDCDNKLIAFPAGFVAGFSFYFYRDNSIALYFMWKTFQIFYNFAGDNGYVPELPFAPVFLHALSTAILFHVAIVEPLNLRTSYWNFLQAMSGGRIALMDRRCIDAFGLDTSKGLEKVLARSRR